ncbi:hypothetical protein BDY24DRAFT_397274 [Mrakia frigida]|uniref:FMN adenylyltransferase n=1 Tax=Mrakia frigida TaxID=29902 RepID=UPI003FCC16E4
MSLRSPTPTISLCHLTRCTLSSPRFNSRMSSTSSAQVSRSSSATTLFPPFPQLVSNSSSSSSKPSLLRTGSETPPISASRRRSMEKKVEEARRVIEDAIDLYGIEHLAISFNGGKDCTLLLHLLKKILSERASSSSSSASSSTPPPPPLLKALYITAPHPFQEVEDFVDQSITDYGLDLVRIGGGMKAALGLYLDDSGEVGVGEEEGKGKGKGVKGMLVGTRRNDPHGASLSHSQPTDPSWPSIMRIHPILNWTYSDVWDYLREYKIPWCSLYDEGYTSLGSSLNTHPNPALLSRPRSTAPNSTTANGYHPGAMYQPAWMLLDDELERAGRGDPPKKDAAAIKEGVKMNGTSS